VPSSVKETLGEHGMGVFVKACCPEGYGTKQKELKTVTSRPCLGKILLEAEVTRTVG